MALDGKTPRFTHNCKKCVYLGEWNGNDLYWCPQGGLPTVLARYGDDGPEYQSGMEAGRCNLLPELGEAYRRAVEKGLISGTTNQG